MLCSSAGADPENHIEIGKGRRPKPTKTKKPGAGSNRASGDHFNRGIGARVGLPRRVWGPDAAGKNVTGNRKFPGGARPKPAPPRSSYAAPKKEAPTRGWPGLPVPYGGTCDGEGKTHHANCSIPAVALSQHLRFCWFMPCCRPCVATLTAFS
jgi:hypothetical protein